MIEVTNLYKAFGDIQAVQNISFQAPNGEITGLLGPNGAGKSTAMRMIAGILNPDQGSASVDGFNMSQQRLDAQKRLGVLPDKRGIYQRLTSRENIRYYGQLHLLPSKQIETRIDEIIKLLDMDEIADRRAEGFSTGQKVKVAIARMLVHDPANLVLDEPTLGLDVMSTRAMRDIIRRLRDEGKTVLLSSHIMQEVAALCDNIVVIAKGTVVAQGTADVLREQSGAENLEDAFVSIIGSGEGLE